ncbi:MAG: helix-turn-helix domain-containing protein [Anaerolineae bacterium]
MAEFFHIKTISEVHRVFGLEKPKHPLISIIRKWPTSDFDFGNVKVISDLYTLSLKGKTKEDARGSFKYGRNSYDFDEGTLVFMAPNQVVTFDEHVEYESHGSGWDILFHPDLIRKSPLGKTIKEYSFFDYDANEALHVSDKEKQMLADLVQRVETELQQNIDKHSQELIILNLESIMTYCHRYYDRQFYTRTNLNSDFVSKFEAYLKEYFSSADLQDLGLPTVTQCGDALNMSGPYLSDLLKVETGKSAKTHIHAHIIEKAKTILLNTNNPINTVAYDLGFEYPQHFSKLFKSKTGVSPSVYRNLN